MPDLKVQDMGLLVDRGVGNRQGLFVSTVAELGAIVRAISNLADTSAMGDAALNAANDAVLVPFVAGLTIVMNRAWWYNGTVVNGNVDAGVYDKDFNRLASTGAVAQTGTDTEQSAPLTVPPTLLAGCPYYLALSSSSGTGRFYNLSTGNSNTARCTGACRAASAHPLPTTVTPVVMANSQIPVFGLTYRTAGI